MRGHSQSGPDQPKNSLPGRRSLHAVLPHSWHSCHWFIDDTGLCAARRAQARVIRERGVVPSAAEFIAPSARRTVVRSCRQRRTNLTNATNGAATILASTHSPAPINQKTVCLAVEDCTRYCPIRGIRVIGSLMTRDCAPRGPDRAATLARLPPADGLACDVNRSSHLGRLAGAPDCPRLLRGPTFALARPLSMHR